MTFCIMTALLFVGLNSILYGASRIHRDRNRLDDAGVDTNHIHYEDTIHSIIQMILEPMALLRGGELLDNLSADLTATFE